MDGLTFTIRIDDMPEVVARLRHEFADLLVERASEVDDENVERELLEIAARFETAL